MQNEENYLSRIPDALTSINSKAGYNIYENYSINIKSINNLTLLEKQAILAVYTGDVTFNQFAAEIKFHAYALENIMYKLHYNNALRADMALGADYTVFLSSLSAPYYDLNSWYVQEQIQHHSEY